MVAHRVNNYARSHIFGVGKDGGLGFFVLLFGFCCFGFFNNKLKDFHTNLEFELWKKKAKHKVQ